MSQWLSVQSKNADVHGPAADMLTSNQVTQDEHHLRQGTLH